jgi:hypothetical protein
MYQDRTQDLANKNGVAMSKITATTYVLIPIGTTIELYTEARPTVGQEFDIRHIDTKKVVQRAKVTKFEDANWNTRRKHYHVFAEIIICIKGR